MDDHGTIVLMWWPGTPGEFSYALYAIPKQTMSSTQTSGITVGGMSSYKLYQVNGEFSTHVVSKTVDVRVN